MPAADRVYGLLLLAYPAGFRREYGEEMARVFRDLYQESRRSGGFRLVMFWLHILADVAASASGEHMETLLHPSRERRPRAVWVAFAGAALALLFGAEALLRSLARSLPALGPDTRPVPEVFLLVIIAAILPVALCVMLAVGISTTVSKRRLRTGRRPAPRPRAVGLSILR